MIKSQLSFAHAVRRDHVNRAQNQAARTLKERKEIEGPQAPRVCKGLWVKLASALLLVLVFLEWSKLWKKRNNSRLSCFQIQHGKDSYWRINSGCLADRRSWSLLAFSRLPLWRRHRLPSVCLCAVHVQFTCSSCAVHVQFTCFYLLLLLEINVLLTSSFSGYCKLALAIIYKKSRCISFKCPIMVNRKAHLWKALIRDSGERNRGPSGSVPWSCLMLFR